MTSLPDQPRQSHAAPAPLFLQSPARPEQARTMRHAAARYVQGLGWPGDVVEAVTLAVGEAINNAVNYGQETAGAEVSLCCSLAPPDALIIEVRNPGTCFRPDVASLSILPDGFATHGRGFALMSMLMDEVQVFSEDHETVVRLLKRCTAHITP